MWYPILITILVGYLLGNLNGAVCMSTLMAHEDVRSQGSGNAGLTNFARNYGGIGSLAVVLIDGGKAALACLAGGLMLAPFDMCLEGMAIGGLALMLGHDFPALLGFKGGKGILTGWFIAFTIDWRVGAFIGVVFFVVYFLTHYVSLASVLSAVAFSVGFAVFHCRDMVVMTGAIIMSLLTLFMHRENILRLVKGEEKKVHLFTSKKA